MKKFFYMAVAIGVFTVAAADPTASLGRVLPRVQLLTGEVYTQATITAVNEDGITITTADGTVTISRYALDPAARVALGFPEEATMKPIKGWFRVAQVGKGSYIVRLYTPPAAAGSFAKLNNEIFGRTSIQDQSGSDGPDRYLLRGHVDEALADNDIIEGYYVTTKETQTFTTTDGAAATVRVMILVTGRRYAGAQ